MMSQAPAPMTMRSSRCRYALSPAPCQAGGRPRYDRMMAKYRTSISEQTLSRYLREMGYRKPSARPRHNAQNREVVAEFRKSSLSAWKRSHDQRTASSYTFGAICPERGVRAGLVLPWCNSATMSLHLAEISQAVSPGAHAAVLADRAGWHTSPKLNVPANISLLALPPKSPELNPTENVWQYLRDNWLSNRVFTSGRDIVNHCCDAWNRLIDQPWTIMSIGLREWAYG